MKKFLIFPTLLLGVLIHVNASYAKATVAKPMLYTPQQGETNVSLTPRLSWAMDPSKFRFQVSKDSIFTVIIIDSVFDPSLAGHYPVIGPLQNKTLYYWHVRAYLGTDSIWSDVWHFTTIAATPINPTRASVQQLEMRSGNILQFSLSQKASVKIQIFDSKGAMVKTLVNETRGKGSYSVQLPAEFSDGYYLLDFTAGKFHKVIPIQGK